MKLNDIELTKFQALFIKFLRIKCDGSWRWVAGKYHARYTDKTPFNFESTFGGNQIDGMTLCSSAQKLLNDKTEDGWN